MNLISIKTFDNSIEAFIMKAKFESENIECFIFDEHIITMNPLYNIAVGGIKLKIDASNFEKASQIINEYQKASLKDENGEILKCSKCGSDDFYFGFKSMKSIKGFILGVLSIILLAFPLYYKTVHKCKACNHEF